MRHTFGYILPVVALMGAAQPAMAADRSGGSFRVSAQVPVSCNLETRSFVAQDNQSVVTGTMFEACNTNRGFQVIATHRALADNERVRVRYGFEASELNPTGFSFVALRSGARFGPVPVQIEASEIDQPISISFSLTAI